MGDPRRLRNKTERPKKLWDVDRLKEEKTLKAEYGLRNMRELWRAVAELKKYRREARRLLSLTEDERRDDAKKVLAKLARLGMLKEGAVIDDVLSLDVRVVLERRLETMVLRKGLARTTAQSRQLITHGFISIGGKKVTRPGYLVSMDEESSLSHARPIDISVREAEEKPAPAEEKTAPAEEKTAPAEEKPADKPESPEAKAS
jgi:small subunit ribosomal protein S4